MGMECRAALEHAEQQGIPPEDRLHQFYRTMHSAACRCGGWACRLAILMLAVSGVWVVGCTMLSPS